MLFGYFRDFNIDVFPTVFPDSSQIELYKTLQSVLNKNSVLIQTALLCVDSKVPQANSVQYSFVKKDKKTFNLYVNEKNLFTVEFSLKAKVFDFHALCLEAAETLDQSFFDHKEGLRSYLSEQNLQNEIKIDCNNDIDSFIYVVNWSQSGLYLISNSESSLPMFSITQDENEGYVLHCKYAVKVSSTLSESATYESTALAIGFNSGLFFKRNNAIEVSLRLLYMLHKMRATTQCIAYIPKKIFDYLCKHTLIREIQDAYMLSFVRAHPYIPK